MKTLKNIFKSPFIKYHIGSWVVWTFLITFLIGINIKNERVESMDLAINTARSTLAKDTMFRL